MRLNALAGANPFKSFQIVLSNSERLLVGSASQLDFRPARHRRVA